MGRSPLWEERCSGARAGSIVHQLNECLVTPQASTSPQPCSGLLRGTPCPSRPPTPPHLLWENGSSPVTYSWCSSPALFNTAADLLTFPNTHGSNASQHLTVCSGPTSNRTGLRPALSSCGYCLNAALTTQTANAGFLYAENKIDPCVNSFSTRLNHTCIV